MDQAKQREAMFMSLIAMLSENAMMALGKIVPPGASEPMLNLDMARVMIDTLDVLKERSEGNRTKDESRFLEVQLTNLRLNFLEVQKEGKEGDEDKDKSSTDKETTSDSEDSESEDKG
jgi:hypothetical protein